MQKRLAVGGLATLGVATAIVLGTAAAASAHIEASADSTAADSYTDVTFSVPHGCDGSPTTAVRIDIPESVIEVTPTVNPNWTITKATEPYTSPTASSDGDGDEAAAQRVTSVTYTAKTPLAADERDTMVLTFALPDGKAGDVLRFPTTQTCERGTVAWDQVQKAGAAEPAHPAPSITLSDAETADGHGHGTSTADGATSATPEPRAAGSQDDGTDVVGRSLGLGGLVLGAAGLVVAVATSRRRGATK